MNVEELIQKLELDERIELFELDTTVIGGSDHIYFHGGVDSLMAPVVWQTKTYQPWPIMADGFDVTTKGTLPRPRLQVANITGTITALMRDYEDLIGAKVIRRCTFARYLDGQPTADPNQHLPDDVFFVERKVNENRVVVEFELSSAFDLEGQQLPARTIVVSTCPWDYRSTECSYTGSSYFDVNNNAVGSLALDVCSKSVSGCKKRFGERGRLPFGGFPAARAYKY